MPSADEPASMTGATTIATLADLRDRGYSLTFHCPDHGARLADIAALIAKYGPEASYLVSGPVRVKCAECGRRLTRRTISAR